MNYKIIFMIVYFILKLNLKNVESVQPHKPYEDEFGLCRTKLYDKVEKLKKDYPGVRAWRHNASVII